VAARESVFGRTVLDRQPVHVVDLPEETREFPAGSAAARTLGFRTMLAVPLLREGATIGVIGIRRREAEPFTDGQIALLQTFADQAVIAIENVRLFNELQQKNEALTTAHAQVTEALDQQTATSEILRVISQSPTDVQPVFDAIAENVVRLCDGKSAVVYRFDGELIHVVAHNKGLTSEWLDTFMKFYPAPPSRTSMIARAILERTVIHVRDFDDADVSPASREMARAIGHGSTLAVPILRNDLPIGAIAVGRTDRHGAPRPFSEREIDLVKTFADQAVIAIENVRLFKELEARNRRLTATGEILQVISRSPTDVQPVFDTIAERAMRLCDAAFGGVYMFDGALTHLSALANVNAEGVDALRQAFPVAPSRGTAVGRVILTGDVVQIADVLADPEYQLTNQAQAARYRCALGVPMLHQGRAIGVIIVTRREPGTFSDDQVQLLKTFADQAVIAIENVRLFTELQEKNQALTQAHAQVSEALEQQTTTSEILRVISSSPTDVQPVFDMIAARAMTLCDAELCLVQRSDGELLQLAAIHGADPAGVDVARNGFPMPLSTESCGGRAVRTRSVVHVPDVLDDRTYALKEQARAMRFRSGLAVPMLRDEEVIGAVFVGRSKPGLFSDTQVELLKTFADQAVIAIENVRLFTELQEKNRALTQAHAQVTEALDQQTATAEILRVISSSPIDVQPVFEAIARAATRLCEADLSGVYPFDGTLINFAAEHGRTSEEIDAARRAFPQPPSRLSVTARAILAAAVVQVDDVSQDSDVAETLRMFRTVVSVPMLKDRRPVGAITVARRVVWPFTDTHIELLKTFADQAVIAIENVRLFTELDARNRELTQALERQTATAEILRAISQSQTEVQPVFDAIADNAMRLFRAWGVTVFRVDGQLYRAATARGGASGSVQGLLEHPGWPMKRDLIAGRCMLDRTPIHIADIDSDPLGTPTALPGQTMRDFARARGWRALLAAPMLRDEQPVGAIIVSRAEAGSFTPAEIDLLKTFADQAVIAVENARLLGELQARTGELTRSVEELTALGDVGRALSSTLDLETVLRTIVTRANELAGTDGGSIYEYDEGDAVFRLRASSYVDPHDAAILDPIGRATPIPSGQGVASRAAALRQPVQIPDIAVEAAYESPIREPLLQAGYRAILTVPLLLEEQVIGALGVSRKMPGEFAPEIVRLLTTFATQSALAIQNARLFREIEEKSRELEAASRHKSEFLANMSHELRTPLNAVIGFSEVLSEGMFGEINEKQTEYLNDILESGRHLLSLINDILDLSKIEAGRMELEETDFDLPGAIENALILVRERAGRRGITLGREIDERIGTVRADERKVKQVLLNLLSNALKFTPEGGRIDVRAALHDDVAEISVADTGVGIAPEDQEAVFEEFRQVGTAAKKVEGTGLGLALSRKFIELHGGKIWVKSQVGVGSMFTFTLPVRHGE
jgi:GAF domain-containing protein